MLYDGSDRFCNGSRHRDSEARDDEARAVKRQNTKNLPLTYRALLLSAPTLPTQPPSFGGGAVLSSARANGSQLDCI